MGLTRKILGQATPGASTEADLYTVPSSTQVVVTAVVATNRSATPAVVRLMTVPNGGVTGNDDYLWYDVTLKGREALPWTVPITLDAADVVRVYASTANVTWQAFGMEVT